MSRKPQAVPEISARPDARLVCDRALRSDWGQEGLARHPPLGTGEARDRPANQPHGRARGADRRRPRAG